MKYKIIGLVACVSMLLVAFFGGTLVSGTEQKRFHQHLEAAEKQPCAHTHAKGQLCSHLPLINIDTGGVAIPGVGLRDEEDNRSGYSTAADGSDRITAQLTVVDSETQYNHPSDTPVLSSQMTIHVRGNSSRYFDKSGYRIHLMKEDGSDNDQSMLGMAAHSDWALHGPYIDKTLIRNYMWYNIAGEIMDYAPNARFCEVTLNGEYQGVYVLVETVTAGENGARLNLSMDEKNSTYSGYVVRLDRKTENVIQTFSSYTKRTKQKIDIVYPKTGKLTPELTEAVRQDFSDFEKMLYSYDFDNSDTGYKNYLDLESFVDYFLINEFTCNYDAGWLSTYMYKDLDGKYRMCIWDFNSACDNYQETMIAPNHFEMQNCLWYVMLIKDEDFTEQLVSRYRELRKTYFDADYLNTYIDSCVEYLGPAIERNFEKWGYTFQEEYDVLEPTERNSRNYGEALSSMKNFLKSRIFWMDENIESLKQYSKDSKIKKFDENAN